LERQKEALLLPKSKNDAAWTWKVDFRLGDFNDIDLLLPDRCNYLRQSIWIEAKGLATPEFKLKYRLFKRVGIGLIYIVNGISDFDRLIPKGGLDYMIQSLLINSDCN
jgi:hypothetical protein